MFESSSLFLGTFVNTSIRGYSMAQLPGGDWLIQQIGGEVVLFNRHDEHEIVRFDPSNANEAAIAQGTIAFSPELDAEQRSFAHFWSGYFYAHASGNIE